MYSALCRRPAHLLRRSLHPVNCLDVGDMLLPQRHRCHNLRYRIYILRTMQRQRRGQHVLPDQRYSGRPLSQRRAMRQSRLSLLVEGELH